MQWLQNNTESNFSDEKSRTAFGERTFGNCITITIDGVETFWQIHEAIRQAKSSICIASYDFDPQLRLIREGMQQQSPPNLIHSQCKTEEQKQSFNRDNGAKITDITLEGLLVEKAMQGLDIKIVVWEPRFIIRAMPGSKKRGIEGRAKKVKTLRKLARRYGVENRIEIRFDSNAPALTSGFHEKIIIVDSKIGFCGGYDLLGNKWDTSCHGFENPSRDNGSSPWHDIHAMVKGPILWDLIFHFNQRWVFAMTKKIQEARDVKIGSLAFFSMPFVANTNYDPEGDTEIIALRTWKGLDMDGNGLKGSSSTDEGIRSWYARMFKKAKYSIYVEDQFPFQDISITNTLKKQMEQEKNLKAIIVLPMKPNLPKSALALISKESINDINNNLSSLRKAGGGRVKTYSLISQHPSIAEKRTQIYVHSKIMIVDDRWITIGSANMDRKGFKDSTELDIGVTSPKLAKQTRVKLWNEHISHESPSLSSFDLNDFESGFKAWETLANDNGKRVLDNEPIQGHAYYYNFEEINLPSPYPNAK